MRALVITNTLFSTSLQWGEKVRLFKDPGVGTLKPVKCSCTVNSFAKPAAIWGNTGTW